MRISDWSSDVCSSDLVKAGGSVSPHRVYNIGNNRPEELMHMIDVLEEAVGKKAVRDFQPLQAGDVPETYANRSEEHTSELQALMRISYAVFCFKKNKQENRRNTRQNSRQYFDYVMRYNHINKHQHSNIVHTSM